MPGFPDSFAPFYATPPGTMVSSTISKVTGSLITNLREMTQKYQNRTARWNKDKHVPSGWGHVKEPSPLEKIAHFAYEKLQFKDSLKPGSK
jgi:hydrogenase small subunit